MENFLIKNDESDLAKRVIDLINEKFDTCFQGHNKYYGVVDNHPTFRSKVNEREIDILIDLEKAEKILL